MALSRIATMSLHNRTLADVLRVQADLAGLQNQVSSGLKSQDFKGLDGEVEQFVQLEAKMRKTDQYLVNNNLILSRMRTSEVAMEQIISLADDFEDLLVARRNGATGQDVQFQISAEAMREAIAGQLNTNLGGRYLFAGSRTGVPPVTSPVPGSITAGVPDDNYYVGNDDDLTTRVQDNYLVQYGVRANDPAFQKLFAAINLGLSADAANSQDLLAQASELATEAFKEVTAVRARLQQNIVNVEEVNARHEQLNLYWKGVTEKIGKADVLSASTEIAMNEAILQASFQSFARLSQLRLTDFLR